MRCASIVRTGSLRCSFEYKQGIDAVPGPCLSQQRRAAAKGTCCWALQRKDTGELHASDALEKWTLAFTSSPSPCVCFNIRQLPTAGGNRAVKIVADRERIE